MILRDAHPQTQQYPGAHYSWMLGLGHKVPLEWCRVLHATSKQELLGSLETGEKPQEGDQCCISKMSLAPSSSVIDALTPQVCPKNRFDVPHKS